MSDGQFFCWIAAFLVWSPIVGTILIKRYDIDGAALWAMCIMAFFVITVLVMGRAGPPVHGVGGEALFSSREFFGLLIWFLIAPFLALLIERCPRLMQRLLRR